MLKRKFSGSGLQCCRWRYGSIFIRLAVIASQICESPWNSPQIRTYSTSRSSRVINLGANRKRIYNFLLVLLHLSYCICICLSVCVCNYTVSQKGTSILLPITLANINWFSKFFHCLNLAINLHIRLAIIASQNREIMQNSYKSWHYSSSRSSKVIDLDVNRKLICDLPISHK